MEHFMNTAAEAVSANIQGGKKKNELSTPRMILLGIMAGAFIAIGGAASSVGMHGIADVGTARLVAGCIFPVGLMMIIFVGGELFTGNCLISMAVFDRQTTLKKMLRNLSIVYISNFLGALILDVLILFSGQLDFSGGALGALTIKTAVSKCSISFGRCVVSGILCNILVCLAILMAGAAKDAAGKIFAAFFPIFAFVISGYEHCVANMFYIPMGMLASTNSSYVTLAEELYGITGEQLSRLSVAGALSNLIPVTLGNIIGGSLFVGVLCYLVHIKTKSN